MFIVIRIFLGRVFLPLVVAGGFVFACADSAWADDVYNFYFQKWPASGTNVATPQSTVPSGPASADSLKSQEPDVLKADTPRGDIKKPEIIKPGDGAANSTTTSLTAANAVPPTEEFRRWSIGLGVNRIEDQSTLNGNSETQGYAFDLGYAFSRYFGLDGELYVSNDTVNALWGGAENQISPLHQLDGSLGMTITPFHILLFGSNFLSLGIQLGGICELVGGGVNWDGALYYGALASVNVTDRISFVVDAKRYNDIAYDYVNYGVGDPSNIANHLTPGNMNAYEYGVLLKLKL